MTRTVHSLSRFAVLAAAVACSPALAGPQLEVRIDNQVIPSFSQQLLADTLVGEQQSLIVVLRNIGDAALEFSEVPPIQLSGAFAGQYAVVQPALESGGVLSPNGSTAFRVDFQPDLRFQGLNANVFIFTNDPAAAPYRLILRGNGVAPTARLFAAAAADEVGAEFDFGPVEIGAAIEQTFVIENDGSGELKLTGPVSLAGDAALTVTQQPAASVAPGDSTTFSVRFAPSAEVNASALLAIPTNDPDRTGPIEVSLLGRGQPLEEEEQGNGAGEEGGQDDGEGEADDVDGAAPNTPVGDEPAVDEPIDAYDPNDPELNADDEDANDPNYGDAGANDPNLATDAEEQFDANDGELDRDPIEDLEPIVPGGLCGFGVGFASLASMISLGGLKRRR